MANGIQTKAQMGTGAAKRAQLPPIFPWEMGDLVIPESGCGLGNPTVTNAKNMAQPFREQIGFLIFSRDAISGALTMKASTQIDFFATGEGEAPPSNAAIALPWVQNVAGTNLFQGGATVTRDNLFAAMAFGVGIGRPFVLAKNEAGTTYLKERHFSPWADSYGQRIRDAFWTLYGFTVTFRNAACNFELGTPSNYAPNAGQSGGDTVRAGNGFGVLGMLPVDRGPVYMGAIDEQNQATVSLFSVAEDIVLDQDDMIPTVGDLVVPLLLTAYGDYGPWCGPCGPTAEDIDAALVKRLSALGITPAVLAQLAAKNQ